MIAVSILIALFGKPSPGVPAWIAYLACGVFLLVGLVFALQALQCLRAAALIVPLIPIGMAVIATWIGFGPGERHCTGTSSLFGLRKVGFGGCRLAFGAGAVLLWAFVLAIAGRTYLRKRRPD